MIPYLQFFCHFTVSFQAQLNDQLLAVQITKQAALKWEELDRTMTALNVLASYSQYPYYHGYELKCGN